MRKKTDYFFWISESRGGYIRLKNQKNFPGGDEPSFGEFEYVEVGA